MGPALGSRWGQAWGWGWGQGAKQLWGQAPSEPGPPTMAVRGAWVHVAVVWDPPKPLP